MNENKAIQHLIISNFSAFSRVFAVFSVGIFKKREVIFDVNNPFNGKKMALIELLDLKKIRKLSLTTTKPLQYVQIHYRYRLFPWFFIRFSTNTAAIQCGNRPRQFWSAAYFRKN